MPELHRHEHRHVAAEAVDAVLAEPELHRLGLTLPDGAVGVVELRRVGPVPRHGGCARGVAFVPVGGLFDNPAGVARRMVGHPVQQHLHAQAVRLGHEGVEIGHRPHLGVDGAVVANRIVGAQRALAPLDADGIDGHEPYGIDAHVAQHRQPRGCGPKRPFGGELADVHFVDDGLIAPFGMIHRIHCLLLPFKSNCSHFAPPPCRTRVAPRRSLHRSPTLRSRAKSAGGMPRRTNRGGRREGLARPEAGIQSVRRRFGGPKIHFFRQF